MTGIPTTRISTGMMEIKLTDPQQVVYQKPYRMSPGQREMVRHRVAELESAGVIRPSQSPFASPVLIVPKKTGDWRMAVDY
ncbi:unnamed protein product, partial [Nesidiocoris tenuis]